MNKKNLSNNPSEKKRNSGLELLRILCILLIIAHHYYYWGALYIESEPFSFSKVFVQSASMFGRSACSIFVLITGYFTIQKEVKYNRLTFLFLEMLTYSLLFVFVAKFFNLCPVSNKDILLSFFPIPFGNWFVVNYILFMLIVPFLNRLLTLLSKDEFKKLATIVLSLFIILPLVTSNKMRFSDLDFFFVMYILGAFFKLYPPLIKKIKWGTCSIVTIILMVSSCLCFNYIGHFWGIHKFVQHATYFQTFNSVLSIAFAISMFFYFKNLNFTNKWINYISKSVVGIYLIHDNKFMRQVIWGVAPLADGYNPFIHLPLKVLSIFFICLLIDIIRREFLERYYKRFIK